MIEGPLPPLLVAFLWLAVALTLLLFSQRILNRELQTILLLLLRKPQRAILLFSFLFFPGVFLHESSHYLTARLLGIRTGRFSLIPKVLPGGQIRLGYVEMASTNVLRDSLVGAAPLLTGCLVVAWVALNKLGFDRMGEVFFSGGFQQEITVVASLPKQQDFWLWFYLVFAVSTTMFPSSSDRRGWLTLGLLAVLFLAFALVAGAGPWIERIIAPWIIRMMQGLTGVFAASLVIQITLLLPLWLLRSLFTLAAGVRVRSG